MWDGFNKRKFPRVNIRCEIVIRAAVQSEPIVTVTENLGIGGVCVLLDEELARFSECSLRLELSEKTPKVKCGGKIVWNVETQALKGKKKLFDTGIEFTDLDPSEADRIKRFLELQASPAPSKPE